MQAELALAKHPALDGSRRAFPLRQSGHMFVWHKGQAARDALNAPLQAFFPRPQRTAPPGTSLKLTCQETWWSQVEVIAVRP